MHGIPRNATMGEMFMVLLVVVRKGDMSLCRIYDNI